MRRLPVLLALLATPAAVFAQAAVDSRWTFDDARGGFCIWYLADPALAKELVPKDVTLRPAGTDAAGLPPSLARVIQDEPHFAQWVPGTVCIGLYGSVTVDDRSPVTAKAGDAVMVMTHSLGATSPKGAAGADHFLVELATDRGSLARAAESIGARTFDRTVEIGKVPGSEEDAEIVIKFGKTRIIWQGHPTGDARVEWTRSMSFGYAGLRLSNWEVGFDGAPQSVRPMVGALRVEGKDDFANVLRASPIRAAGPMEWGGSASITFRRAGGR